MAYEVTATRRRPKTFDELAGQDFVSSTLQASLEQGIIAHAYLFSGPRGCGKTSAARILARSLNCINGPIPCGLCPACQDINSLDIIEIDGASNTSVNDVRQIKDEVLFPPNSGKYKTYIIDEVHMLSNSAFNALLKTIEEPPPYIIFIFATTELHRVPATIKSRCQQFAFKSIPIETIKRLLQETCAEMNIQAEDEALFWIAREATGSMRDAYTLFDQIISISNGDIRTELIKEKLGLVGLEELNGLAQACIENNNGAAIETIDRILEAGIAIEQFVIDLAGYYRSLLLIKAGIEKESLLGYSVDRFSKAWERLSLAQLEQAVSMLLDLYRDIRYSLSPRFELETAVSKLCALDKWISPPELRKAVEAAKTVLGGAKKAEPLPEKPFTSEGGSKEPGSIEPGSPEPSSPEPSPPEPSSSEAGSISEGFKQFLANRKAASEHAEQMGQENKDTEIDDAEKVRQCFKGTYVKQGEENEY